MFSDLFTPIWDDMHMIALGLQPSEGELGPITRQNFIRYIESKLILLPCIGCAKHAIDYFINHKLDPKTAKEAYEWTVAFHNFVNKGLGKREYTPEEAKAALEKRMQGELRNLPRSNIRQKEDHAKIKELQDEIKLFRNIPHVVTNESLFGYILAALIVGIAILLLLIALFAVFMHTRKHMMITHTAAAAVTH